MVADAPQSKEEPELFSLEREKNQDGAFIGQSLWFWCPGCDEGHRVPVGTRCDGKGWSWNGDAASPTLSPSVLSLGRVRCHLFVREGKIDFCDDCDHALRGQKRVTPKPLPEWLRTRGR